MSIQTEPNPRLAEKHQSEVELRSELSTLQGEVGNLAGTNSDPDADPKPEPKGK